MIKYNNITFEMDKDFHEMTELEKKEHNASVIPDSLSIYNSQCHTMISFQYKRINAVIGVIVDKKTLRKRMEYDYKKTQPIIGNIEEYETVIGKRKRYGFRYKYTVNNIVFIGDVLSIIDKGHSYLISCYYREENQEYGSKAMSKLLSTIVLE